MLKEVDWVVWCVMLVMYFVGGDGVGIGMLLWLLSGGLFVCFIDDVCIFVFMLVNMLIGENCSCFEMVLLIVVMCIFGIVIVYVRLIFMGVVNVMVLLVDCVLDGMVMIVMCVWIDLCNWLFEWVL